MRSQTGHGVTWFPPGSMLLGCAGGAGWRVRGSGSGAGAGQLVAAGAAGGVALGGVVEGEVELVGERCQPGQDVAQFVLLPADGPFAYGLGQLAELLAQPGDRGGSSALGVAGSVGAGDGVLELGDVHDR